jgi:antitoxin (DNA-binding transcriptional repressor) of toxin-antitoxin stability system
MPTVTLEEAQAHLARLIEGLRPGEAILITRDQKPVARLTVAEESSKPPRRLGTLKGSVLFMAPDFDAPLDDFKEYME